MSNRLAVVLRAWLTRRLLWVWLAAYTCVIASGYLWPWLPRDAYFECPSWALPRGVSANIPWRGTGVPSVLLGQDDRVGPTNTRDVVVKGPIVNLPRFKQSIRKYWPALERLFVGGYRDDPVGFQRLCQALPEVRVWHLDLNAGRLASTVFLLFVTLLLGGAVMQQTTAIFSLAPARLYPQFVVPHLIPPLTICVAGIAAASFISSRYGSNIWATAAVQVLAWGVWSALEFRLLLVQPRFSHASNAAMPENNGGSTSTWRSHWFQGVALVVAIAAGYLSFVARPYVVESFLLGELPWLSAGLFAVGAVLGVSGIVLAPKLPVALNEAGIAPVLSMQDIEKRRVAPSPLSLPFHRQLEPLRQLNRSSSWWWRIRAMDMGNPNLITSVLIKIVGPVAVVAVCGWFFAAELFSRAFVVLLVDIGWFATLSSCFSTWWQRRKTFSVQLLYPWTRQQLTLSAFAAYSLDALVSMTLLFATVVVCNLTLGWHLGATVIFRGALVFVGVAAVVVTGGLWLLTLRHRLWASFLAFAGVMLLITTLSLEWRTVEQVNLWYFLSTKVLPYLTVASFLGTTAYRRWMQSEWGLLGPS